MAGTVTGKNAKVWIGAHLAGTAAIIGTMDAHSTYGIGEFSLTLSRDTVEQNLIGSRGNYFVPGTLSVEGSLTAAKFGGSTDEIFDNLLDTDAGTYKYIAISGTVTTDTDVSSYLSWFFQSCQITGYDVSIGDADTITEASIDFTTLLPQNITYAAGCIKDC